MFETGRTFTFNKINFFASSLANSDRIGERCDSHPSFLFFIGHGILSNQRLIEFNLHVQR